MEERGDQRVQVYRSAAEYSRKINLGAGSPVELRLKILPRPSGRAHPRHLHRVRPAGARRSSRTT
jgi:hypothetical protein